MPTSFTWGQNCTNEHWSYNPGDPQEKTSLLSSPSPIPIKSADKERAEVRINRTSKKKEREKTG